MANKTLLIQGRKTKEQTLTTLGGGIEPFAGEWNWENAAHLLKRSSFGPTYEEIQQSVVDGLDKTINNLFAPQPEPDLPINFYFKNDPEVPIGETWVGKPTTRDVKGLIPARNASLSAWSIGLMYDKPMNVLEKLILFWHNHLVVSNIFGPESKLQYLGVLRKYALGDFKQMVKDITISPAMLEYLNGNENTAKSPNENYAREVLELFTIGKGPIIAPGDYTNYTENDIQEIARAFTGWKFVPRRGTVTFLSRNHDTGTKQLSEHFNNAVIPNLGDKEYEKVIDIIFEQEEVSRFIVRQLYIWYVNSDISSDIEISIIEPLAQIFRDNDYHVEPVLKALFKSAHFYASCNKGVMVKSPIDYVLMTLRTGRLTEQQDILRKYNIWAAISRVLRSMEQMMFFLPSVAGWQAYYQEPVYYRYWISSVSLSLRDEFMKAVVQRKLRGRGLKDMGLELLDLIALFENPDNPDELLRALSQLFMPFELTDEQIAFLKTEILIPGLPDYEWTEEYGNYLDDPTNEDLRNAVLGRLQAVVSVMLSMPENQLM